MKEILKLYARLISQYNYKCQTVFSASFDKQNEDVEVIDDIELYIISNIKQKLTESDIDKIDVRSQLEQQIQNQESEDSGWRVDKNNSLTKSFCQTTQLNGSNYVKLAMRSSVILNTGNVVKYCCLLQPQLIFIL